MRQPMLDPERDFKGATPETLAKALLRGRDMPGALKGEDKNCDEGGQGNDASHCPEPEDLTDERYYELWFGLHVLNFLKKLEPEGSDLFVICSREIDALKIRLGQNTDI